MIPVAAYCRVSTDKEDQVNSFLSQQQYFTTYIENHPDWQLFRIYADEGITGTSTKKRAQFNRMIRDAYNRQFKLIITKEVSRFSRNILDVISYTRELKTLGIGVYFMADGFNSLDPDAELRLSIMGSIAQEESRRISERVKWGQTRQMEKGIVFGTSMLGYDLINGVLHINPYGAEIVKQIFHKYGIEKMGTRVIAEELTKAGYQTLTGTAEWRETQILRILKNEKYVGDLIQKKTITPNYLTHEKKYNHGEEKQVVIRSHHEPIITRELWETVQSEIHKRRRTKGSSQPHSSQYAYSGKIICGECGSRFVARSKTKKDGSSYRRWGCFRASKYGSDTNNGCNIGKQIREDLIADMVKFVFSSLEIDYKDVIQDLFGLIHPKIQPGSVPDHTDLTRKQIHKIRAKKLKIIDLHASGHISQEEFDLLTVRYNTELESLQKRFPSSPESNTSAGDTLTAEMSEYLESILTGKSNSSTYTKILLESIVIHRNGTVDIKLNQLDIIWRFRLYKR